MAGEPDGTLLNWGDIAAAHKWDTLLLGNGMSINIWEPFKYRVLYDHARSAGLSPQDRRMTSYDLLVYWAMATAGFEPFMDHFRFGGRCEFDPARASVPANRIPVYFLHGALHLVTGGSGATWKLTQTDLDTVLDQFGKPIEEDTKARPLLVTEGSAADKLTAIDDNVYLSHALKRLSERDLPLVVFGSSLSEHDAHLAEALSEHPDRPVAISMLPAPKRELLAQQVDICGRLGANPLLFYDATTHPVGNRAFSVPVVARR